MKPHRSTILRNSLPGFLISAVIIFLFTVVDPYLIGLAVGKATSIATIILLGFLCVVFITKAFYRKLPLRKAALIGGRTVLTVTIIYLITYLLARALGLRWGLIASTGIIISYFVLKKRKAYLTTLTTAETMVFGKPLKEFPHGQYPKVKIVWKKKQ